MQTGARNSLCCGDTCRVVGGVNMREAPGLLLTRARGCRTCAHVSYFYPLFLCRGARLGHQPRNKTGTPNLVPDIRIESSHCYALVKTRPRFSPILINAPYEHQVLIMVPSPREVRPCRPVAQAVCQPITLHATQQIHNRLCGAH